MLKNKLAIFVGKRVFICGIILSIIGMVLFDNKIYVVCGLLAGMIVSLVKFRSYYWIFNRIVSAGSNSNSKKSVAGSLLTFILNQITVYLFLYLAYKFSFWFFISFVAGILLVPFVVMINCVTEAIGITKNNFE